MIKLLSLSALAALAVPATTFAQIDFAPQASYPVGTNPDQTAIADFNGDGLADLATSSDNPDKVVVHFNLGGGVFGNRVDILVGRSTSPTAVGAVDADCDGDLDIAVALRDSQLLQILTNTGGTFVPGPTYAVGTRPVDLEIADLNGDGRDDVTVSNRDGNTVTVLLNQCGSFSSATYGAGAEPREVAAGDLDQDGDRDLAVASQDSRGVQILLNQGAGTFVTGPFLSVGGQLRPEGVDIADFSGDGIMDLAASTSGNGQNFVSTWTQTAPGAFSGPLHWNSGGLDPSSVVAADYDLDGDQDVATVNKDSNNMAALPNLGGGSFGAASTYGAGTSPDHLAKGDLDGNGSMDLVATNSDGTTISVYLNRASGFNPWDDLGKGLAGSLGVPSLTGTGPLTAGSSTTLSIANALPNGIGFLFVGLSQLNAPFKGGTLCPNPDFIFLAQSLDGAGGRTYQASWPAGIDAGTEFYFQFWTLDNNAVQGMSATNAVRGTSQ